MEPLIVALLFHLEEIKGTLMELKAGNAVLRNEIFGAGNSAGTKEERGILEEKTLRELVEEIRFDINIIKQESKQSLKREMQNHGRKASFLDEVRGEFPVVEIKQKTIEEEKAWIKFIEERAKLRDPADGASLAGKTVDSISSSIPRTRQETSCVLKLCKAFKHNFFIFNFLELLGSEIVRAFLGISVNNLNSDLMDPQGRVYCGSQVSGPTNAIFGNSSEAFAFLERNARNLDEVLDEFPVSEIKKKTIEDDRTWIKSTFDEEKAKLPDPADGVERNASILDEVLLEFPVTEIKQKTIEEERTWIKSTFDEEKAKLSDPADGMGRNVSSLEETLGEFPVVEIKQKTIKEERAWIKSTFDEEKAKLPDPADGASLVGKTVDSISSSIPRPRQETSCVLKLGNFLNVSLNNPRRFTSNDGLLKHNRLNALLIKNAKRSRPKIKTKEDGLNEAPPAEVHPFTRAAFFSSETADLEGMISYEIASTDLGLSVAFRVREKDNFKNIIFPKNNAFSAAFVPLPAKNDQRTFNLAMDEEQWKSHLYRKYAEAKDGEQEIQIRNIRARVSMTDEEKPQIKILIFTV